MIYKKDIFAEILRAR